MTDLEYILHEGSLAILESIGDAISIQDPDMRIIYQNQVHIKMMGKHDGEECFRAYHGRDSVCPECRLVSALYEGKTGRWDSIALRPDGSKRHVEIVARPLKSSSGKILAAIEAVRDITERKLMSEKIHVITSDLEQRTWKLMAANKELESFSYTLSHDIHNYITRISMASQALKEELSALPMEKVGFLVASIEESCSELELLVDAISLLSRSGRGEIAREVVDLTAVATEVVAELGLQFPERSVAVDIASGLLVVGDWQLLKIALKNLLGNAWKYTAHAALPHVRFHAIVQDGKTVMAVSDNGCGFDMAETAKLFKPFSRLSSAQDIKGTGIGLATVRRIIQAHGGEIWAEGEPAKGASFYFTLALPA